MWCFWKGCRARRCQFSPSPPHAMALACRREKLTIFLETNKVGVMKKYLFSFWLFAAVIAVGSPANCNSAPPERVSLIALLANPSAYDGRIIQVSGFFVFEEENHALYLSPDDANNGITNGGIEINTYQSRFPPNAPLRFNRKYVNLTGEFHAQAASQWPMKNLAGIKVMELTNIRDIRTPPYRYGPVEQSGVQDHLP